jgi:hypothetical protein
MEENEVKKLFKLLTIEAFKKDEYFVLPLHNVFTRIC